jgi:hypothetical protein
MRVLIIGFALSVLCRLSAADTIAHRVKSDPAFKLYATIFKITQAPDGSLTDVQLAGTLDAGWQHEHPKAPLRRVQVNIPKMWLAKAAKKLRAKHWPLYKHSGKSEDWYTYLYYSPQLGDRIVEQVDEPE